MGGGGQGGLHASSADPTTDGGTQSGKLGRDARASHMRVFFLARFGADLHARSALGKQKLPRQSSDKS